MAAWKSIRTAAVRALWRGCQLQLLLRVQLRRDVGLLALLTRVLHFLAAASALQCTLPHHNIKFLRKYRTSYTFLRTSPFLRDEARPWLVTAIFK